MTSTAQAARPQPVEAWLALSDDQSLADVMGPRVGFADAIEWRAAGVRVRVVAEADALDELAAQGITVQRVSHGTAPLTDYTGPEDGIALLAELASGRDDAGVREWGRSREDRPLRALWVGQPPDSGAPAVRVLGAHHGDEISSVELALAIAETLCAPDPSPAIAALLDTHTVWVAPYVNPDGVAALSRTNADDVDLNRNYGFEWSANSYLGGPYPFSEPETRAVRNAALLTLPHTSLSLHSGATNIGYVWNYTYDDTAEEGLLDDLGELYADHNTTDDFWVTNGADWYPTRGDTNDWSYDSYGGFDFTVELTREKAPPASQIDGYVAEHLAAALAVLTRTPELQGTVVDALTGEPVAARLQLTEGAVERSAIFAANPLSGRFARHIADDSPTLTVRANGYTTARVTFTAGTPLTVELTPDGRMDAPVQAVVAAPGERIVHSTASSPVVGLYNSSYRTTIGPDDGELLIPDDAPPGPYDLVAVDGTTWPAAVFVTSAGRAAVDAHQRLTDELVVVGSDFGPDPRAYALPIGERGLRALPVLSASAHELRFVLPSDDPARQIWLDTAGTHTALPVTNLSRDDTGPVSPNDTGFVLRRNDEAGCHCSAFAPGAPLWLPLLILPLWRRRL